MTRHLQLIILLLLGLASFGQNSNSKIIFEQNALDFFGDSIIGKIKPFDKYTAHFDGWVDSRITRIEHFQTIIHIDTTTRDITYDQELRKEYLRQEDTTKEYWEKGIPFQLTVKNPIKGTEKKRYDRKSNVIRLKVYQSKKIDVRNFVMIETWIGNGDQGYCLYFVLDDQGRIIKWTSRWFIY